MIKCEEVEAHQVGEAGTLPGSNGGFTMAVFKATDVPVGTKLYAHPPPSAPADEAEETAWREGWAMAYSGADKLYGDDGELQDASDHPFIDWRRDSATEIRTKIQERGMRALSRLGGNSMNDITITPELIADLRERYTPPTIPPCRVCGGELSISQAGGGHSTVWACSGKEDDPERPGWLRDLPGRWSNSPDGYSSEFRPDGHYSLSLWTDHRSGGDSGVIAVLDALEAALAVQQRGRVDD